MDSGFEMNDEMIDFLENKPELEVQVTTAKVCYHVSRAL